MHRLPSENGIELKTPRAIFLHKLVKHYIYWSSVIMKMICQIITNSEEG